MEKKEILAQLNSATLEGWYGLLFGMNRKSKERYVMIKEKDLKIIFDEISSELDKAREEGYIKGIKECTEKLSKLNK